ncbi:MAG: universal stress protein [Pseudomonadota bacterium]|nr:universal stress protein [Pseudomonadota bacterium]
MEIKRILTVIEGSEQDEPLLRQALALAIRHNARLDALFVRRNAASGGDFLGDTFSTYGMETVLEALDDAAAEASVRAHEAFERVADDAPANRLGRLAEFVGLPEAALAQEGRLSDLVVMALPDGDSARHQLSAIKIAACESGRPLLLLPAGRAPDAPLDKAMIAWDGSLEASRAVAGSLPLLEMASSVKAVHAGTDHEDAAQLSRLANYLDRHGVTASTETLALDHRSTARTLIEAAGAAKIDFLVMGGFGAPGWQYALGRDDTTALLKGTSFAILMVH